MSIPATQKIKIFLDNFIVPKMYTFAVLYPGIKLRVNKKIPGEWVRCQGCCFLRSGQGSPLARLQRRCIDSARVLRLAAAGWHFLFCACVFWLRSAAASPCPRGKRGPLDFAAMMCANREKNKKDGKIKIALDNQDLS